VSIAEGNFAAASLRTKKRAPRVRGQSALVLSLCESVVAVLPSFILLSYRMFPTRCKTAKTSKALREKKDSIFALAHFFYGRQKAPFRSTVNYISMLIAKPIENRPPPLSYPYLADSITLSITSPKEAKNRL
jgi:hypothetical protein